ncbi:TPA: hypothetical protein ACH3X3_012791 [Trebouxia sp. C0006]
MSGSGLEHGADADSNAASPATGSLGISQTTDSSQPRTATGNARSAKAYVNNSSASATSDGNFQGSNDVTAQGNADTSAVAGAAGTDITASTDYGSRKSPDGADNGLQGGLHRPDFLSKGGKSLRLSHMMFCCKGCMSCSMVLSTEATLML